MDKNSPVELGMHSVKMSWMTNWSSFVFVAVAQVHRGAVWQLWKLVSLDWICNFYHVMLCIQDLLWQLCLVVIVHWMNSVLLTDDWTDGYSVQVVVVLACNVSVLGLSAPSGLGGRQAGRVVNATQKFWVPIFAPKTGNNTVTPKTSPGIQAQARTK